MKSSNDLGRPLHFRSQDTFIYDLTLPKLWAIEILLFQENLGLRMSWWHIKVHSGSTGLVGEARAGVHDFCLHVSRAFTSLCCWLSDCGPAQLCQILIFLALVTHFIWKIPSCCEFCLKGDCDKIITRNVDCFSMPRILWALCACITQFSRFLYAFYPHFMGEEMLVDGSSSLVEVNLLFCSELGCKPGQSLWC